MIYGTLYGLVCTCNFLEPRSHIRCDETRVNVLPVSIFIRSHRNTSGAYLACVTGRAWQGSSRNSILQLPHPCSRILNRWPWNSPETAKAMLSNLMKLLSSINVSFGIFLTKANSSLPWNSQIDQQALEACYKHGNCLPGKKSTP